MEIGDKIAEMLDIRNMKPSELARKAEVSLSIITELVSKKRNTTTTETLKRIAAALEIHPAYFLESGTVGPGELLKNIVDEEDRRFILSNEGAMWVKLTREASESGISPEKIRKLIDLFKDEA